MKFHHSLAATFGWLCVETLRLSKIYLVLKAATFGWLCVETDVIMRLNAERIGSHLRVAVC